MFLACLPPILSFFSIHTFTYVLLTLHKEPRTFIYSRTIIFPKAPYVTFSDTVSPYPFLAPKTFFCTLWNARSLISKILYIFSFCECSLHLCANGNLAFPYSSSCSRCISGKCLTLSSLAVGEAVICHVFQFMCYKYIRAIQITFLFH